MSTNRVERVAFEAPPERYMQMWDDIRRCNAGRGEMKLGERFESNVPGIDRFNGIGARSYPALRDFTPYMRMQQLFDDVPHAPRNAYMGILPIHRLPSLGELPLMSVNAQSRHGPHPMFTTHLGSDCCWVFLPAGRGDVNFGLLMMVMMGHTRGDCLIT